MRKERMNNKGFSLVELIIVIAIMAILAAALAPQLMKYIEKSRVSTDTSTCASIESCVNAALAEEKAYQQIAAVGSEVTFYIAQGSSAPNFKDMPANCDKFQSELEDSLKQIKNPKQTGKNSYKVTIKVDTETVAEGTGTAQVQKVGDIKVETSATNVQAQQAQPNP